MGYPVHVEGDRDGIYSIGAVEQNARCAGPDASELGGAIRTDSPRSQRRRPAALQPIPGDPLRFVIAESSGAASRPRPTGS